ncbi:cation transporter [Marinilabiliaceae bacterium JC017]|nr:cation transporter [Marinilabiliaceae bacterium JC017]
MKGNKSGIYATVISLFLNIILFGIKLWAGIVSNSVALIADAWHTLSDSISSIAVYVGLKVSAMPADDNHPYGHGRAELVASLVVGILLAVIGFNFLVESVLKLQSRETFNYGLVAIVVTIASIVVKEVMAQYSIIIGKRTNSKSLLADGWHHRSDAISSVIILAGIFLGQKFWWIDGVLGIMVSMLLFYATYSILKDTISVLLGENIEPELKQDIIALSEQVCDYSLDPHHLLIHQYGNHTELTLHIYLPGDYSLTQAHAIATRYELLIAEKLDVSATVHIETREA